MTWCALFKGDTMAVNKSPQDKMIIPGRLKNHILKKRYHIGNMVLYKGDVVPVGRYPELDAQITAEAQHGRRRASTDPIR